MEMVVRTLPANTGLSETLKPENGSAQFIRAERISQLQNPCEQISPKLHCGETRLRASPKL